MIDMKDVITGALLLLIGSIGTGFLGLLRKALKWKKDLDIAFGKIRAHDEQLREIRNGLNHQGIDQSSCQVCQREIL